MILVFMKSNQINPPLVRVRALTGLCDLPGDHPEVRQARKNARNMLGAASDLSWTTLHGQVLVYNLTALAEVGLTQEEVPVEPVVKRLLEQPFDANCSDLMALRAMVMLGYGNDERLLYFLKRRLFYRMDKPGQFVLNQPGRRMADVFFPQEYFHVGLPVLLEAFAALGAGEAVELSEAWSLLEGKKDEHGRIPLEGTLPGKKAYLPREGIGKPTKWGTLYAYLAWKNR
jgi:hypothetical protein